jgi:hypothetical protein
MFGVTIRGAVRRPMISCLTKQLDRSDRFSFEPIQKTRVVFPSTDKPRRMVKAIQRETMRKNIQTSLETSAHLCGLYQPRGRLMPRGGRPEKSQVSNPLQRRWPLALVAASNPQASHDSVARYRRMAGNSRN